MKKKKAAAAKTTKTKKTEKGAKGRRAGKPLTDDDVASVSGGQRQHKPITISHEID